MSTTEGEGPHVGDALDNPGTSSRQQTDMERTIARQQQTSLIPAELTALVMGRAGQYHIPTPRHRRTRPLTRTTQEVVEPSVDDDVQRPGDQAAVGEERTTTRKPTVDAVDAPAYPVTPDVVESSPAGTRNTTSDATPTSMPLPIQTSSTAPTSKIIRFMAHILYFFYFISIKIVVQVVGFLLVAAGPPIATVYVGSLICQSLHYPYYDKRWDSVLIVIGILGPFLALTILYPVWGMLYRESKLVAIFGSPPLRVVTSQRNSTTKTVKEDHPVLFFYYPFFYLYSFFSLVLVSRIGKYPAGGQGPDVFLTVRQIARVASLGALPISVIHFFALPFAYGIWQWTRRGVDKWYARMTGGVEKEHEDSVLRRTCYQYLYWWRKLRDRRVNRRVSIGDGLA